MPKKSSETEVLKCSFCNKDQNNVRKLIAGPTVFICDECVEVCNDIIADDSRFDKSNEPQSLLPIPAEIKKYLDQYVVGQEDGDGLAGEGVDHSTTGYHSPLVECTLGGLAFDVAASGYRCPESVYGGALVVGGEFVDPWVFRGDHGERHAERGVGSGGVDRERLHIGTGGPVVVSNR